MLYRNRARWVCFIYSEKCVIVLPYSFLSHSAISFPFPSFSYFIWSWSNPSPYSLSCIHAFLFPFFSFPFLRFLASTYFSFLSFPFLRFHSVCEAESIHWLTLFLVFTYFSFSTLRVLIYNIKSSQSICWFVFLHSPISLTFCLTSYTIPNCVNVCAYSFSRIQLFDLSGFHFHITYDGQAIDLLILFQSITSLIFKRHHLPLWSSIFSFMMVRMNVFDVSDTVILFLVSSHKSRRKYEIFLLQNIFLFFTHSTLLFFLLDFLQFSLNDNCQLVTFLTF